MRLRNIEFGRVLGASGVQGFFGEGYWFHKVPILGANFKGVTFVAKTTTLFNRVGNLPLRGDFTPKEFFPPCIVVKPLKGVALNAVGLSGPGARTLFETGNWQTRKDPFFISFMSVAGSVSERLKEILEFTRLFRNYLPEFDGKVGLQINYSCPNVGLHVENLIDEVETGLEIATELRIPLMPKFNVLLPVEAAAKISDHPACDAICVSNTIPWGQLKDRISWHGLFGKTMSPLEHLGGGGLSGRPLLPLLLEWILKARSAGVAKPLNAGGGILSTYDAASVMAEGANSIFLGSIAFLRPWRIQRIVQDMSEL